jgi:hypothetical protein
MSEQRLLLYTALAPGLMAAGWGYAAYIVQEIWRLTAPADPAPASVSSAAYFYNYPSSETCAICLETLEGTDSVAHAGDGEKHPFHPDCIETSFNYQPQCPCCRQTFTIRKTSTCQLT